MVRISNRKSSLLHYKLRSLQEPLAFLLGGVYTRVYRPLDVLGEWTILGQVPGLLAHTPANAAFADSTVVCTDEGRPHVSGRGGGVHHELAAERVVRRRAV